MVSVRSARGRRMQDFRRGRAPLRAGPSSHGSKRPPDIVNEEKGAYRASSRADLQRDGSDGRRPYPGDPASNEQGQTKVRDPQVPARLRSAVQRVSTESRHHVVGDTEDHHAHEAEEIRVDVRGTVDEG